MKKDYVVYFNKTAVGFFETLEDAERWVNETLVEGNPYEIWEL